MSDPVTLSIRFGRVAHLIHKAAGMSVNDLEAYLAAHPCKGFQPVPRYAPEGDMLEVYWDEGRPDGGYEDPVNPHLTVMRAFDDNRPIGVKVYGVGIMVDAGRANR